MQRACNWRERERERERNQCGRDPLRIRIIFVNTHSHSFLRDIFVRARVRPCILYSSGVAGCWQLESSVINIIQILFSAAVQQTWYSTCHKWWLNLSMVSLHRAQTHTNINEQQVNDTYYMDWSLHAPISTWWKHGTNNDRYKLLCDFLHICISSWCNWKLKWWWVGDRVGLVITEKGMFSCDRVRFHSIAPNYRLTVLSSARRSSVKYWSVTHISKLRTTACISHGGRFEPSQQREIT